MFLALVALLSAAASAAPDFARISTRDFEDFESCYGSFKGASTVLPKLRTEIPPDDFAAIAHAMGNLADDFADLEKRLSHLMPGADRNLLMQARSLGTEAWEIPQNQTLAYWSGNGPMSVNCFALTKRLGEDLPQGF
ncbi:MAG TPA: hypothetical protein VFW28_09170 [Micropepsaceae bacterium]|nr:hypothetical protein [Micropepsaceae bacterium]